MRSSALWVSTGSATSLPSTFPTATSVCSASHWRLAAGPRLLLLDEPMTGMNPVETAGMIDFVRRLRDDGHTIVLVEHDMKAVMSLSDRIVVLARGTKITEGTPEEIRHNDEVIEAISEREIPSMLLEIKDVRIHYAKAEALKGVCLHVEEGEIVTLVGANGAGKTTILRAVSGLKKPSSGEILFQGRKINGISPHKVARLGIGHVPEGRRVFAPLTVAENLELGAYLRRDRAAIRRELESAYEHFPVLKRKESQKAGSLSGGEQQMLATARALMGDPKLLLMDEPSMGLSPLLVMEMAKMIKRINERGITVILVEQNARLALALAHRA